MFPVADQCTDTYVIVSVTLPTQGMSGNHTTPHHITSHRTKSHHIATNHMTLLRITSHRTTQCLILFSVRRQIAPNDNASDHTISLQTTLQYTEDNTSLVESKTQIYSGRVEAKRRTAERAGMGGGHDVRRRNGLS